jgi:hypothetical protein
MSKMPSSDSVALLIAGILVLLAGVRDWDWVMTKFPGAIFVYIIGRQKTRTIYGIIGLSGILYAFFV